MWGEDTTGGVRDDGFREDDFEFSSSDGEGSDAFVDAASDSGAAAASGDGEGAGEAAEEGFEAGEGPEVPEEPPKLPVAERSMATVPEHFHGLEKDLKAAAAAKEEGNALYKSGQLDEAVTAYSRAIALCPAAEEHHYSRSVFHCNRAAVYVRQELWEAVDDDCTLALELQPGYVKAHLRRCQAREKLDRQEDALEDAQAVVRIDPSLVAARRTAERLEREVKEKQEKMKEEMLGKLKDLGNTVLGKFGLSVDNFKFEQDPATGSYSVNFVQNAGKS